MTGRARTIGRIAALALLTAALDQGVKALVVAMLPLGASRAVIPRVLDFAHRENTGVAFSLGQHLPAAVLATVNLVVLAVFVFLIRPYLAWRAGRISAVLVIGGALGNLIDRLARQGRVIDYLDFHIWPVFNLADACVVAGVLLLVVVIFNSERVKPPPSKHATEKDPA